MLEYELIKKAVISRLKPLGNSIPASEIRSGFKKPAFFVQIVPIEDECDCDISTNTISIYIHYFSDEKTDLDNLKMLSKLRKLFINCIDIDERTLTLYNKSYELEDNLLQFKFDLIYTEEVEKEIDPSLEMMKDLYIN